MAKPSTRTHCTPDRSNPYCCPPTVDPDEPRKMIGALEVPDRVSVTFSLYVPAATATVSPATALAAAALIVQKGWPPLSEQPAPLLTLRVAALAVGVTASGIPMDTNMATIQAE